MRLSVWTPKEGLLACMQDRSVFLATGISKLGNVQVLDGRSIYVREDREDGAMRGRSPRVGGETNGAVLERGPRATNGAPAAEGTKVAFHAQLSEPYGLGRLSSIAEMALQQSFRLNSVYVANFLSQSKVSLSR